MCCRPSAIMGQQRSCRIKCSHEPDGGSKPIETLAGTILDNASASEDRAVLLDASVHEAHWLRDHLAWFIVGSRPDNFQGFLSAYRTRMRPGVSGLIRSCHGGHPGSGREVFRKTLQDAFSSCGKLSKKKSRDALGDPSFRVVAANQQPDVRTIDGFKSVGGAGSSVVED